MATPTHCYTGPLSKNVFKDAKVSLKILGLSEELMSHDSALGPAEVHRLFTDAGRHHLQGEGGATLQHVDPSFRENHKSKSSNVDHTRS